jgi:hypothetical protein
MRDYGQVHSTFWSSPTIQPLSDDGKLLALYLMTCSHNTIAGVFRLPDGYMAEDIGWDTERVSKGFAELLRNGFANRCQTTKWVWIRKHLEWNAPQNPNQWKAVHKIISTIPESCEWVGEFNRFETVVEHQNNPPVPVPVPVKGGAGGKKAKPTDTPLPENFAISDRVLKWAAKNGHAAVLELHLEAFISTCKAKGYTYADWDEAFMGAVRKNWAQIKPQARQGNGVAL